MRYLLIFVLSLSATARGGTCVILKEHVKHASEALFRWTQPQPFDYVEGDFPKGMKFHYEVGDKTIRKIKEQDGKVIIVKPDYSLAELEDARKQCGIQKPEAAK